jgi:hypothetical protein
MSQEWPPRTCIKPSGRPRAARTVPAFPDAPYQGGAVLAATLGLSPGTICWVLNYWRVSVPIGTDGYRLDAPGCPRAGAFFFLTEPRTKRPLNVGHNERGRQLEAGPGERDSPGPLAQPQQRPRWDPSVTCCTDDTGIFEPSLEFAAGPGQTRGLPGAARLCRGVDRSYVGGLEQRAENPTIDLLDRLAKTLKVPLSEFFAQPAKGAPTPKPLPRGRKVSPPKRAKP